MNKIFLCLAATFAFACTGCGHTPKDDGLGHDHHDHDHEAHDHSTENHNHGAGEEIILPPCTAKELGVEVTEIEPRAFSEVLKVMGSVAPSTSGQSIVAATSSGIVTFRAGIMEGSSVRAGQTIATISSRGMAGGDVNASSKAALDAAKRELDRLTPLQKEGIVSTRDYNAALAAYESAKAAHSGSPSGGVAVARTSGVITTIDAATGQYVDAGQPLATINSGDGLMLRANVPARDAHFLSKITSANVVVPSSGITLTGQQLGLSLLNVSTAATQNGYTPVFFRIAHPDGLMLGTNVEVYLIGASGAQTLAVPRVAVVEQQGQHFVYVQVDEEGYEKRHVALGNSDGSNVAILSGIKAGERVVTAGATMVRLAESSGAVPEGHSHNH